MQDFKGELNSFIFSIGFQILKLLFFKWLEKRAKRDLMH